MQGRKALVVGIDEYASSPLYGCVADANAVAEVLGKNGDGSPNFSIHLERNVECPFELKRMIEDCFSGDPEIALLYFAGHGGRCDVTKNGFILSGKGYPGGQLSLDEILAIANSSKAKNRVILLDSCNSGCMGTPGVLGGTSCLLGEGLTILSACCSNECAEELNGCGTFTSLLVDALNGGAADVMGHVTPGGVYAYIDKALGPWDQRPVFRTNVNSFISLRKVVSQVPDSVLRQLPSLFDAPGAQLSLDPSFEPTNSPDWEEHRIVEPYATRDNMEKFKILQQLEGIGLVRPVGAEHMYFAAMESKSCELTALGKQYWRLADTGKI